VRESERKSLFWQRVNRQNRGKGCWLWNGSCNKEGYGQLRVNGKIVKAHRYAWEILKGDIPEGWELWRTCLQPSCVNPAHRVLKQRRCSLDQRIRKKIAVQRSGGCWEWTGRLSRGYPVIKVDGRPVTVHRIVYESEYHTSLERRRIFRTCSSKLCVNPAHMRPGKRKRRKRRSLDIQESRAAVQRNAP